MTPKQKLVLSILAYHQRNSMVMPSYDELMKTTKFHRSALNGMINNLEEQGYIKRSPQKARAIRVMKKGLRFGNLLYDSRHGPMMIVPFKGNRDLPVSVNFNPALGSKEQLFCQ